MRLVEREVPTVMQGLRRELGRLKAALKAEGYGIDSGAAKDAFELGCYRWTKDVKAEKGLPWGEDLNAAVNAEAERIEEALKRGFRKAAMMLPIECNVSMGDGTVIVELPWGTVGTVETRMYRDKRR